jgi:transposase-like protein
VLIATGAKLFVCKALVNRDNLAPGVLATDGLRSYPASIRDLKEVPDPHLRRIR